MKTIDERPATPAPWRYEAATKTIRSVPANYWLATMDSWDGAVNHEANAKLIAAAPEMLEALHSVTRLLDQSPATGARVSEASANLAIDIARAAIAKAVQS